LGVCLGHQAIGEAFGGKLVNLSTVYHGVATKINVVSRESKANSKASSIVSHHSLFDDLPDEFEAGRYHSWIVSDENFPNELEVTARDENNYIMALQHRSFDVRGVQFHPESVLTPVGETILRNWLNC
jgi:anthranilate synthase component 2